MIATYERERRKKKYPGKSSAPVGGENRRKEAREELGGAGSGRNIRGSEPRESVLCFCLFSLVSS